MRVSSSDVVEAITGLQRAVTKVVGNLTNSSQWLHQRTSKGACKLMYHAAVMVTCEATDILVWSLQQIYQQLLRLARLNY